MKTIVHSMYNDRYNNDKISMKINLMKKENVVILE